MTTIKNTPLQRELGLTSLIVYYFSTIVGVGIFIVPLLAAKIAGPASIIAWICVLLCAYPFAMIFAHISQKYKVSGSVQKFLEDSWGVKFGKSMALFLVVTALFGNGLLGFTAARYFNELFNTHFNIYWLGCAFLIIPILFNLLQIGLSSKIQVFSLIILVVLLEILVISSIPHYNFDNLVPFTPNGLEAIIPAIAICFYSIVGWENVDAMAEEVKNPGKIYKKAAMIAILLISIFYISIALTIVMVLDHKALVDSTTMLTAILQVTMNFTAGKAGALVAIILLTLGANAWVFGTSRIIFALARDNILPKGLTKISNNNIPYSAVIAQIVPYLIISFSFLIIDINEDLVVEITSLNYLTLYTIIFFSGIRSFASKSYKTLSMIAMIITATVVFQSSYHKVGICFVLLLLCFVYVYYFKYKLSPNAKSIV